MMRGACETAQGRARGSPGLLGWALTGGGKMGLSGRDAVESKLVALLDHVEERHLALAKLLGPG